MEGKKRAFGSLLFSDRSVPLSCQLKMETMGEKGIGMDNGMRLSASERLRSLAGFWLAIYLASHHPSCSIGAEPIEWRPRGIVQLMMTGEDQLVIVQSNCSEHRHIGQQ